MSFREWQISHYTQRKSESKSFKEKQFLTDTLSGLKSETNENSHYPLYVFLPFTTNDVYKP